MSAIATEHRAATMRHRGMDRPTGMPELVRWVDEVAAMAPRAIVISPGPCAPAQAGISVPVIRALGARIPILGVCLGHQAIGEAYGGRVVRARRIMHGKPRKPRKNAPPGG